MDKRNHKAAKPFKGNKRKSRKVRKGKRSGKLNSAHRPTLILKGRYAITQNLTGVNVKQINIIPTLSTLSADILS